MMQQDIKQSLPLAQELRQIDWLEHRLGLEPGI